MTRPRCGSLVVHEYLLDPREGLVWQVSGKRRRWLWLLKTWSFRQLVKRFPLR